MIKMSSSLIGKVLIPSKSLSEINRGAAHEFDVGGLQMLPNLARCSSASDISETFYNYPNKTGISVSSCDRYAVGAFVRGSRLRPSIAHA